MSTGAVSVPWRRIAIIAVKAMTSTLGNPERDARVPILAPLLGTITAPHQAACDRSAGRTEDKRSAQATRRRREQQETRFCLLGEHQNERRRSRNHDEGYIPPIPQSPRVHLRASSTSRSTIRQEAHNGASRTLGEPPALSRPERKLMTLIFPPECRLARLAY